MLSVCMGILSVCMQIPSASAAYPCLGHLYRTNLEGNLTKYFRHVSLYEELERYLMKNFCPARSEIANHKENWTELQTD